jgi:hypothetical protein
MRLASETAPPEAWDRLRRACLASAAERVRRQFHAEEFPPDVFPNSSDEEKAAVSLPSS